jgi:hypothetical protein
LAMVITMATLFIMATLTQGVNQKADD